MDHTLDQLEVERDRLIRQLSQCGDMRKGSITETYRSCGKKTCWCHQKGRSGHGPFYAFTTKVQGKTQTVQLRPGPLLNKYREEVQAYREFRRLCDELITLNESICRIRVLAEGVLSDDPKKKFYRSSKRK
jgi:hypothetical protein